MTDIMTHYDLLVEEGNDPYRDPPVLKNYMDRWDGALFLDLMRLDGTKTVLEIGVGTGRIAARVIPRCRHFTGIDLSPRTIERARENLAGQGEITLICGDFLAYPFDTAFDVICSTLTMMHFPEKRRVLDKAASLLRAGGRLCLSIDKNRDEWIDMGSRRIRVYPDTPEEIISLAIRAGMHAESVQETENAFIIVCTK